MRPLTQEILTSPCVSFALKDTLKTFLDRDCVDALNDAELLVKVLKAELRDKLNMVEVK